MPSAPPARQRDGVNGAARALRRTDRVPGAGDLHSARPRSMRARAPSRTIRRARRAREPLVQRAPARSRAPAPRAAAFGQVPQLANGGGGGRSLPQTSASTTVTQPRASTDTSKKSPLRPNGADWPLVIRKFSASTATPPHQTARRAVGSVRHAIDGSINGCPDDALPPSPSIVPIPIPTPSRCPIGFPLARPQSSGGPR